MDKLYDISFFFQKNSKQHPNVLGAQIFLMESVGAADTKISELVENLLASKTEFFAKS